MPPKLKLSAESISLAVHDTNGGSFVVNILMMDGRTETVRLRPEMYVSDLKLLVEQQQGCARSTQSFFILDDTRAAEADDEMDLVLQDAQQMSTLMQYTHCTEELPLQLATFEIVEVVIDVDVGCWPANDHRGYETAIGVQIIGSSRAAPVHFIFHPGCVWGDGLARAGDQQGGNQNIGWRPASDTFHRFTVTCRNTNLHTLKITDADGNRVWSINVEQGGWWSPSLSLEDVVVTASQEQTLRLVSGQEAAWVDPRGDTHKAVLRGIDPKYAITKGANLTYERTF
jgi:hypothetical protein